MIFQPHKPVFKQPVLLAALVVLPVLIVLVYLPGLYGPFVFDDAVNIVDNPAIAHPSMTIDWFIEILRSGIAGPTGRPLAYLTFALNYYYAGNFNDTLAFKLTNVFIHVANSLLVWYFLNLLVTHLISTSRLQDIMAVRLVPPLAATLFAVHPIQLTNVLYVVQRMNSLSALFVLIGLSAFIHGRLVLLSSHARAFLLMGTGLLTGLLGLASKENAILVMPLALVVEYTIFSRNPLPAKTRTRLKLFYLFAVGTPLLAAVLWLSLEPSFLMKTYVGRNFDLTERLSTEARILWFYLYLLAIPRSSNFSLFHDDISISRGLFDPVTTFFAILGIIILALVAVRFRRRFPVISFAIGWFFVGHALESSIFGLELAHEHRNYLPSIGLALVAAYGIATIATAFSSSTIPLVFASGLIVVFSVTTSVRAAAWSDEKRLIHYTLENSPRSPRAHVMYGDFLLKREPDPRAATGSFVQAYRLDPSEPAYLIAVQLVATSISSAASGYQRATTPGKCEGVTQPVVDDYSCYLYEKMDSAKRPRFLLRPEVSRQVIALLQQKPASPMAVSLLTMILDHILGSASETEYLIPDAASWAFVAANNPFLPPADRLNLLVRLTDIHIAKKNYREALRSAFLGIARTPDQAEYRIMAADVLLYLQRCEEAQSHIYFVLRNRDNAIEQKATAASLLQRIQQRPACRNASIYGPASSAK